MRIGFVKVDAPLVASLLNLACVFFLDGGPLVASAALGWALAAILSLQANLERDLRALDKGEPLP